MKTVLVKFENEIYNYSTSINGTDEEITEYFVGRCLNLGSGEHDLTQTCEAVEIFG